MVGRFQVKHVRFPGAEGLLGVGANHTPFVSKLKSGILFFETVQSERQYYYVSGGLVHIESNNLDILVESLESPKEIDKQKAKDLEKQSLEVLKHLTPQTDISRTLEALEQARQRIQLVESVEGRNPGH